MTPLSALSPAAILPTRRREMKELTNRCETKFPYPHGSGTWFYGHLTSSPFLLSRFLCEPWRIFLFSFYVVTSSHEFGCRWPKTRQKIERREEEIRIKGKTSFVIWKKNPTRWCKQKRKVWGPSDAIRERERERKRNEQREKREIGRLSSSFPF